MATTRQQITQNRHTVDLIIEELRPEQILAAFYTTPSIAQDEITISNFLLPGMLYSDCNQTRKKKLKKKILQWLEGLERRSVVSRSPSGWWRYTGESIPIITWEGKTFFLLWRSSEAERADVCLFCGKNHIHGTGDGHRGRHCLDADHAKPKGLFLSEIVIGDLMLRADDGYIVKTRAKK